MRPDTIQLLRDHGIHPTAQRLAVATYALATGDHPSADEVWNRVRDAFPLVSRATVYNTLNLFVEKGLMKQLVLTEGRVVFDPNVERHHHFIDIETGRITDLSWDAMAVSGVDRLQSIEGVDVEEYQVIVRGRRRTGRP